MKDHERAITTTTAVVIIAAAVIFQHQQAAGIKIKANNVGICSADRSDFTTFYKPFGSKYYSSISSALQIFTSAVVPCNGYLHTWGFLNRNGYINNLHLAVFRQLTNNATSVPTFIIVNATKLTASRFSEIFYEAKLPMYPDMAYIKVDDKYEQYGKLQMKRNIWYELAIPVPFRVKRGDFLGVFYEKFTTSSELLTVPMHSSYEIAAAGNSTCYIFLKDEPSLSLTSPLHPNARYNIPLNPKYSGAVDFREPALYARITRHYKTPTTPWKYRDFALKYFEP